MPTYEYECEKCKHVWETFLKKVPKTNVAGVCPACGSAFTKTCISRSEIHFHFTDKEVRIPSPPTSVYIRRE